VIRCELENMTGSGARGSGEGASTIISLLPEGSPVKRGDVLARLDSSTYEEMLRQQEIVVEQAKASHLQATLDTEIAALAVREYRNGTVQEMLQSMDGAIALARSDLSRAIDRLGWTKHMKEKGYASVAQCTKDEDTVERTKVSLQRQIASLDLFRRFTQLKAEKTLQGQVKAAETSLNNETLRLQRQRERLALLAKQVDRCTIRAPHDGVLFYYKDDRRNDVQIEEGLAVRQSQPLFYLPDLSEMEVVTALNESIVDRVRPGMRATIRFEALHELVISGQVLSISQIPNRQNPRGEDIRYFFGIVKLDRVTPVLKPGMTARVDIALARRDNVLAIPHQAVRSDHGKKVCYVALDEKLVRREVKIGQDTTDLIEVDDGLQEGDLVVLNPPKSVTDEESLRDPDEFDEVSPSDRNTVAASHR
jgi:HlyD family secretion protein